jgi:hypothetical protein
VAAGGRLPTFDGAAGPESKEFWRSDMKSLAPPPSTTSAGRPLLEDGSGHFHHGPAARLHSVCGGEALR